MISADVKADLKQQEIKGMVVASYNFCKYLQDLKLNLKQVRSLH